MLRRQLLTRLSVALTASFIAPKSIFANSTTSKAVTSSQNTPIVPGDWKKLRTLFPLTDKYIQLSTFLLASHPKPVADAIERHRKGLDENPSDYWHEKFMTIDREIAESAANYMGGKAENIALTDSTTMGLALVYTGLKLNPGDEILQTEHDHYSTDMSLSYSAKRTGATVKRIALYDQPEKANTNQILARINAGITTKTKVLALTWVHSSTGVKLPIRAIADLLQKVNQKRSANNQILFCVDGVHGFGIEDQDISQLGCDFFIAGTHKWIFGPRGTGIIWAKKQAWKKTDVVIPSFSASYDVWLGNERQENVPMGEHMSPGGFHSFEHRWALPEAFKLHMQLGKHNVQKRIHQLNTQTKEGLASMPNVTLYTPMSTDLSSGLVCFDVDGMKPEEVVHKMHKKGIIMSNTPYKHTFARFAPSLLNTEKEIEQALREIRALT